MDPISDLRGAVSDAASELRGDGPVELPHLERPPRPDFGDYSTNAAMLLAPSMGESPRAIAEKLGEVVGDRLGEAVERVEIAGPGFLNLFLGDGWFGDCLRQVLGEGDAFGGGGAREREKVNVEFVSANPTGPMHAGHARNAAYGDALARLLELHGHDVTREFYVNDYGSQVRRFAESIRARARGEEPPDDGYRGDYVADLASLDDGVDLDALGQAAVTAMVERMRASLERFGVTIDEWFSERTLHPLAVEHTFELLEKQGHAYRSEGALWLRTTTFGDDKDRVLVRSTGEHTYFASDIAYHENKRERGFDRLIDVWGADHHGYVPRMKAMFAALGGDPDRLDLLIMQFVHLVSHDGERSSMSKRSGEFVTLDELVDEIGVDAARWYLLARSHDTTIELDLDLAKAESAENPVYYVQYAHARIESVLAKAGSAGTDFGELVVALDPAERALVKKLLAFGLEIEEAVDRRAPHRIATYALELAQDFTAFYRDCRIAGAEPAEVERFRIALSVAARRTIARSLALLGVSAPEAM